MSSILEALRELEGSDSPATQHESEWGEERSGFHRALAVTLVIVAVGGAATAAYFWGRTDSRPETTSTGPTTALAPAAPAPAPAPAVLDADPPRARVASRETAAAPAMSTAEPPVQAAPLRAPKRPAPRLAAAAAPRLAGEPRVHVSAVNHSSRPEERAVVLSLDGGSELTLHEGDTVDGVEVQLILPESIYVRHRGQIFAVPTR